MITINTQIIWSHRLPEYLQITTLGELSSKKIDCARGDYSRQLFTKHQRFSSYKIDWTPADHLDNALGRHIINGKNKHDIINGDNNLISKDRSLNQRSLNWNISELVVMEVKLNKSMKFHIITYNKIASQYRISFKRLCPVLTYEIKFLVFVSS